MKPSRGELFVRKLATSLRRLWQNLLDATVKYLRSKTVMPSLLPKGSRATIHSLLERPHHQEFLQRFGQENGIPVELVEGTFRKYLSEIAADLNYLVFPFWDLLLTWTFEMTYEGLDVDAASLASLREQAASRPVVFVSNHRSHMDYLLLSYVFYRHRVPLPHVCAGANLSFWPLGPLGRKSGAFFIRRSFEGNKLYAAAVQAYLEELLRERTPLEFFIEGTRSRTGKLLPPRFGILSAIVKSYQNGAADDILLVPTSLTYESVLEEKSYLAEQAGAPKQAETFWDLLRLPQYLKRIFLKTKKGKVYLRFGPPVSLKDFYRPILQKGQERKEVVRQIASELTYGINKSIVVTPASLVATALLTHSGRSISKKGLEDKIDLYLDYLQFKECRLSEPLQKDRPYAIEESLKNYVKRHWIQAFENGRETLYRVREDRRPLLDYYKNTSLPFLVSIGVLCTLLKVHGEEAIPLTELEKGYAGIQDLFQYEFTFSRRQPLRNHLEKLLEYLERKEVVRTQGTMLKILPEGREALSFFSAPLKNFLEGYQILWKTLQGEDRRREHRELLERAQRDTQIAFLKEEIHHPEAGNRFLLQNALLSLRDLGWVREETEGSGKKKKTYYRPSETIQYMSWLFTATQQL